MGKRRGVWVSMHLFESLLSLGISVYHQVRDSAFLTPFLSSDSTNRAAEG